MLQPACVAEQNAYLDTLISSQDCEGAARQIAQDSNKAIDALKKSQQIGGTAASYTVSAVALTADIAIDVAMLGLVVVEVAPVILSHGALPLLPLPTPTDHPSDRNANASVAANKGTPLSSLTRRTFAATERWRENTLAAALTQNLRRIGSCYEKRDSLADLLRAALQLAQIHQAHLYDQITASDRSLVDADISRVKARLLVLDPHFQVDLDRKNHQLASSIKAQHATIAWRDLATGAWWRFQPTVVANGAQAKLVCDLAEASMLMWHLPNRADALLAVKHCLTADDQNPAFAAARSKSSLAYVRDGDNGFAVLNPATGEVSESEGRSEVELLCAQ